MKNEKAIITAFVNHIKANYPLAYTKKIKQDISSRGFPDLIIIITGVSLFLEAKQKGKFPTILQKTCINEIAKSGGVAGWFDYDKDLDSFRIFFNEEVLKSMDSSILNKDEKSELYYILLKRNSFKLHMEDLFWSLKS